MLRKVLLLGLLVGLGFDAQAIHHQDKQLEDDEALIREPVRYKLKLAEWNPRSSHEDTRATFDILQNGSFLERVTLPAQSSQHVRFEARLSPELNHNPLIPLPRTLGEVVERVRYTFAYKGKEKAFDRVWVTRLPLHAKWVCLEERDFRENHYTLALTTLGERGETIDVHQERPFEGTPERHVFVDKLKEALECYFFDEDMVTSEYLLRTLWQNPHTQERYVSEQRYRENGIPSHEGREVIYVKPFVLRGEVCGGRNPYQGRYTYQRDLEERECLEGRETNRLLYSDGRSFYFPYVTQELWQGESSSTSFFVASYRKEDQLFFYPSVLARNPWLQERGLPEGLYHLVSLQEGDRRVEQWVRLEGEPYRADIDIGSEPSGIPGRQVVMPPSFDDPKKEAIHRALTNSPYRGPERAWSVLSSNVPKEEISADLNHYLREHMRTEAVRRIAGYCKHKFETCNGDVHLLREDFLRLGRRLKDLGRVSQRDSLRMTEGLRYLVDLTIFNRGLELLRYLEHQRVKVEYRVTEWMAPLVDLSSRILALGSPPQIERVRGQTWISSVLLSATDIQEAIDGALRGSVGAYAWNRVLLERDIRAPGRTLCIVAPTFKIGEARTINLRGASGAGGGRSSFSKDGAPGGPGQSGGNFYARTSHSSGTGTLHVDVSGGNGGRGGNGRDGADGTDGQDGDLGVVTREPGWMGPQNTGPNGDYWSREVGQYKYHEALGTDGSSGGDGGRAGAGGRGGLPGAVSVEGISCTVIAQEGDEGGDGCKGEGGLGGLHGKHAQGAFLIRWHHDEGRWCGKKVKHPTPRERPNGTDTIVPLQHQPSRGRAASGCRGIGVNSAGRRAPEPQVPLRREAIIQDYQRAYQEAARNPFISLFVGAFPGLELE